jgi:hypothetical protein
MENVEMDKLIAEATQALNDLVKSEQSVLEQELKKSQGEQVSASKPTAQADAAPKVKKNESSSSSPSVKKDEGSGYENMSPEASGSSSSSSGSPASDGSSAAAPVPAPEASGSSSSSGSPESSSGSSGSSDGSSGSSSDSSGSSSSDSSGSGDEDHIGQMLAELDDDRLQHLYMKAKAELMARMHRDESPSKPQEQPMDQGAMAMSEKVKELEGKLAKAETEKADLKKACSAVLDMTDKLTRRPVKKAITDIKFVERGAAENLAKAEGMSEVELKKHINDISKDYNKLSKFSSEERMTLMDFVVGRKPRAEAVKILSK